jgi:hypothetical protein
MATPADARYGWVKLSLGLGALLAIVLLVNSVWNYVWISRRVVIEQLRHDMSRQAAVLEKQIHQPPATLAAAIAELAKDRRFGWIDVRDASGQVLAHAGMDAAPSFTTVQIHNAMRNHEPLTAIRQTSAGEMVVEAFRLHLAGGPHGPFEHVAAPNGPPPFATVEIATSIDSANAVFWPLRRNLFIDCSAALALLIALIVIRLRFRAYVQGKQLEQQLALASRVQKDLLPRRDQRVAGVELAAECVPAWGVSGDFYDVFPVEDGRVALVLGDVSGKGIPAALLMGVIHGAVRSSSWADSARRHEDSTSRLNRMLCERSSGSRFASMFWSYYEAESGMLHYINAGHCPPLLVQRRNDGTTIRRLDAGGPVLGLLNAARYQQGSEQVLPGDTLILYSDGLLEAADSGDEEFGDDRLRRIIERLPAAKPDELRDEITGAVRAFTGQSGFQDDMTLLAVRFGEAATRGGVTPAYEEAAA